MNGLLLFAFPRLFEKLGFDLREWNALAVDHVGLGPFSTFGVAQSRLLDGPAHKVTLAGRHNLLFGLSRDDALGRSVNWRAATGEQQGSAQNCAGG